MTAQGYLGLNPKSLTTRARILEGAARVMQGKGIRSVRVQDILESSRVSRRTFYQYFKGTDPVLLALYKEAMEELSQRVLKATTLGDTPGQKLKSGIKAYLDYQDDGGQLLIFLQAEAIRPDSTLFHHRQTVLNGLVKMLDALMKNFMQLDLDPFVYWAVLVGVEGLVIHVQRDGHMSKEERVRVEKVILKLLLKVFTPTPSS